MRKYLVILFLLIAMPCGAAEYAVRPPADCSENGNGSSWACAATPGGAGAMNTIPSAIEHGSTYYIGGGAYGKVSFGVITYEGSDYAYVKKATVEIHGPTSGWSNDYAVQATFQEIKISGHYIELDGVTGSGTTGYGIKIEHPAPDIEYSNDIASLLLYGSSSPYGVNYVTVQHIEISMTSGTDCAVIDQAYVDGYEPSTYAIKATRGDFDGIQIKNNYIHGGSTNIHMGAWTESYITGNYFGQNCSRAWSHGQQISPTGGSSYITLANNEFHDTEIYIVGAHNSGSPGNPVLGNSYWYIYNNLSVGGTQSYQAAESAEYDCLMNCQIHHNTFIDGACAPEGCIDTGMQQNVSGTKSYAYNNLFYNMTLVRIGQDCGTTPTDGCVVHDNNAFLKSSGYATTIEDEIAEQVDADAPSTIFTNYAGGVYTINLSDQTAIDHIIGKGTTLASPFDTDYLGITRTEPFDIGAYTAIEDETPPTVSSATIQTNGTDIVIVFSEQITATDDAAFTITPSGSAATVDCPAVASAMNTMTCVISREIQYGESATYGYTGSNVVDTSANALVEISSSPSVVNNSTVGITPPTNIHIGAVFTGGTLR